MTSFNGARRYWTTAAAAVVISFASSAFAQEITESHLKAARATVDAINATDFYDEILPNAAAALKRELIQKNPDLSGLIGQIVDAKTLELAGRRADLEKEAAMAYARVMTEEELSAIAAFYNTGPGLALLKNGPIVTREVAKAAEIWKNGVARDLAQEVAKDLEAKVAATQPAPVTPAPDAPAADAPAPAN